MLFRYPAPILCAAALLGSCGAPAVPEARLTVAAAANLMDIFGEVGRAFRAKSGVEVVLSYGSTAQLAQQLENGAPFDVFAAADTEHIDALVSRGKLAADSRAIYALGQLALWIPKGSFDDMKALGRREIRFIAIAQPELAPYGRATVEALKRSGLWEAVEAKIVYSTNIGQTKRLAESGNADAAFTAYSLVLHERGTILKVDAAEYQPIEQALAIVSASSRQEPAKQFCRFVLGPDGRKILVNGGYRVP